jgi:hypothetical protein
MKRCKQVTAMFAIQQSPERIKIIVDEIKLELEEPTQWVRDILDCRASEGKLREFLRCVV